MIWRSFIQERVGIKCNFTKYVFFIFLQKNADVLFSSFQKPKQKRHRCRNPNKLDINTLTGEERVPVVNKRNGKKVNAGGVVSAVIPCPPKSILSQHLLFKKSRLPEYMHMPCARICACVDGGGAGVELTCLKRVPVPLPRWAGPWRLPWRTCPGGWRRTPSLQLLQTGPI